MFEQLHRAGRQREALAVAAAFARQRPDRAEGWDRAAYAAHHLGDHVLAMRLWGRVLAIEPRHFSRRIDPPRGWLEHRESRKRAGAQPPATLQDLPPAS